MPIADCPMTSAPVPIRKGSMKVLYGIWEEHTPINFVGSAMAAAPSDRAATESKSIICLWRLKMACHQQLRGHRRQRSPIAPTTGTSSGRSCR